jgi:hypothetical protein
MVWLARNRGYEWDFQGIRAKEDSAHSSPTLISRFVARHQPLHNDRKLYQIHTSTALGSVWIISMRSMPAHVSMNHGLLEVRFFVRGHFPPRWKARDGIHNTARIWRGQGRPVSISLSKLIPHCSIIIIPVPWVVRPWGKHQHHRPSPPNKSSPS